MQIPLKTERDSLRLAATMLVVGVLVSFIAGIFHPGHEDPNNHPAAFAEYAASQQWTLIHLGQFVGMLILIAGLLVLASMLDVRAGISAWGARFGAVAAGVSLALYAILQAVDGVALKQAVDAWASASSAEKPARFAAAEAVRWMEWGVRSYQSFMLGLAFILLAWVIIGTGRFARPIGYLMVASGLAYLVQAWVIGSDGFSAANTAPQLLGYLFVLVWTLWLLVQTWRTQPA